MVSITNARCMMEARVRNRSAKCMHCRTDDYALFLFITTMSCFVHLPARLLNLPAAWASNINNYRFRLGAAVVAVHLLLDAGLKATMHNLETLLEISKSR